MLYDMEKNNYFMVRSIELMDAKISELGVAKNITLHKTGYSISDEATGCLTLVSIFISVIISIVIGNIADSFWIGLLSWFVSLLVISFLCFFLSFVYEDSVNKNYNKKYYKIYEEAMQKEKVRLEKENAQKNFLINQRDLLAKRKAEATEKLNGFYSELGIAEEFRNIIPIGYMYEFARLGISDKLTGIDGLYYLTHKELRADCFQLSLNEISRRLDSIIDNQRSISVELRALNDKCDNIIEQTKKKAEISAKNNDLLERAVKNTEISKYNSERIKKELEYQTFIDLWDIKGSNFF